MSTEARLYELADLRKRGLINDTEYAEARRSALGLGQPSAASEDHIVVGTTMVLDPSPQQPLHQPVTCRCGEKMIHVPPPMVIVQVTRNALNVPAVICCSCRFAATGKFVCPAPGCGVSLCEACGRSCGVPYGQYQKWIDSPQQFQTSLVGDWCKDGQTCIESLFYPCLLFHVGRSPAFQHGKASECQGITCFLGAFVTLHEIVFMGVPLACLGGQARQDLRPLYGIQESFMESCLTAWICRCCSIAQVHREMKMRGHDVGNLCKPSPVHYRLTKRCREL